MDKESVGCIRDNFEYEAVIFAWLFKWYTHIKNPQEINFYKIRNARFVVVTIDF